MTTILFFGSLPDLLGTTTEDLQLPDSVNNVGELLAWLRQYKKGWDKFLIDDAVQVTVNKQFAEADTTVSNTDEIAVISIGLAY